MDMRSLTALVRVVVALNGLEPGDDWKAAHLVALPIHPSCESRNPCTRRIPAALSTPSTQFAAPVLTLRQATETG
jgi:hypothetical protein